MVKNFKDTYRGKRVFVTGHTGFKGSWLSQWLLDLGAQVGGYSLGFTSQPSHFELLGLSGKIHHKLGDVRDIKALSQAVTEFKPEIIFHLAAQSLVRPSYDDPKGTMDTNIGGTINLLEVIRQNPTVKAGVIVTSDKCYDNTETDHAFKETDKLGGKDPYSASKGAAEIVFNSYAQSFFSGSGATKLSSVRAGNVIGGGDWAQDRIVPDSVRAWSTGEIVKIRNPKSTRPWQHVLEPLSGYLWVGARLLEKPADAQSEAFNFGPWVDAEQNVETLIQEMKKTWTDAVYGVETDPAATTKKEAGLLKLNCEKAKKKLGWEPTLSFAESVAMTTRWYRQYYKDGKTAAQLTQRQIEEYAELAKQRGRAWA